MTWQNQKQGLPIDIPEVVVSTIEETVSFVQSRSESFVSELKGVIV